MKLRILVSCLLIWSPTILSADDITVRSGEHATFSRLVIYLDPSDTPALTRTADGFRMTSGDATDTFDISRVFDLIPRDRIADVTAPDGGTLDITLNCQCDAVTQTLSNGRFVIDIVDTPPPDSPPAPKRTEQQSPTHDTARLARRGLPIAGVIDGRDGGAPQDQPANPDPVPPPPPAAHPLTEKGLLEQLARAAAQGLVDAPSILNPAEETPPPEQPAAPADQPAPPPELPQSHIRVQTSVDRDADRSVGAAGGSDPGLACFPSDSFAISTWGKEQGEPLDFATYRSTLLTEADTLDPETFRRFIQHQIFLTLGTEAQAYLKKYDGVLPDGADLLLMAEIVEDGTATGHARMTTQLACDGPVAMWAVLSQPRLPRDQPINTAAVISEFSILPRHLRTHLGPMLMRKFLAIGDTDTSIEINQISQRGVETMDSTHALSTAQLSLETGDSADAHDRLTKIVDTDDQNSVDAVLLLVESHIKTQTGISERTLELLGSLAHEHQTSAKGVDLAIAEVRAFIHASRFNAAREKLRAFERFPDREDDRHLLIVNEFGTALTKSGADGTFLRHIIGHSMWADADETTRVPMAERLLALGFATAAKDLLTNQPAPPGRDARLLIAQAALKDGKASVALGYLAGLNDPDAQRVRDAALRATGQLATSEPLPDHAPQVLQHDPAVGMADGPTLGALQKLIEDSAATRARIDAALQAAPAL